MILVARNPSQPFDKTYNHILVITYDFLNRGMVEDAIRAFSTAASTAAYMLSFTGSENVLRLLHDFEIVFRHLCQSCGSEQASQNEAAADQYVELLAARISYLWVLEAAMHADPLVSESVSMRINELLPGTRELLNTAFSTLPDPTPRGRLVEFCETIEMPTYTTKESAPTKTETFWRSQSLEKTDYVNADPDLSSDFAKGPADLKDPEMDLARPTYIRVQTRHLLPETLEHYHLPWEYDQNDDKYLLVKQYIDHDFQNELFQHTKTILNARAASALSKKPESSSKKPKSNLADIVMQWKQNPLNKNKKKSYNW